LAYPYWAGKGCPAASLGERTAAESSTTARLRVMSKCARSAYDLNGSQLQGGHSGQRQKRSLPAPLRPRLGSGGGVGGSHQLDELLYSVSAAVALCGLYQAPLDAYPRENPHLKRIVLCLDADGPKQEATGKFRVNQAAADRAELARLLHISDNQLSYITNVDFGRGRIKCGSAIVPFMDNFPKNRLYRWMTTKFSEQETE
jgi:hypothetical protein